jgi:ABC-2 type transport system permease protein
MTTTTSHPAVAPRPSSWWDNTWVYTARNLRHVREIPEKLLDVTLQPLMFVLLFAYVFGGAIDVQGSNYREYLIGGIVLQSLAFGMTGPAVTMATDLNEGVLDRFRSLPAAKSAYLSGHVLAELASMALSVVVLLASGLLIGWRTQTDALHVAAGLGVIALFASVVVWIGTVIGLFARAPDAVMGITFTVVFPLTFVSNAFVPIETLPPFLQHVAAWNPFSVVVAAVRELFGNPTAPITVGSWPLEHPVVAAVAYCLALHVVVVPLALRRFTARTFD